MFLVLREGFPNVLLQAGAMECPVVCSDIPGNIDIVNDKSTGLHYEVYNTEDLQSKIGYALENFKIMKNYASNLRAIIESKYDRLYVQNELLSFYNQKTI